MPETHVLVPKPKAVERVLTRPRSPSYEAYQILHLGFTIAPIIAGVDKFLNLLVNWDQYFAPAFARLTPFSVHTTMMVIGVIEIVAGILVAVRPLLGGWVVAAWLWAIIIDLFFCGSYWDIALRDFGLSLGAVALARLAVQHEEHRARAAVD